MTKVESPRTADPDTRSLAEPVLMKTSSLPEERLEGAHVLARPEIIVCCGLVMSSGLLLLALANNNSVHGSSGYWLFWAGILLIMAPAAWRLTAAEVARSERIVLLVMEGGFLYLAKVVREPTSFTFHDEFVHWLNADNALRLGHLFAFNPLIPATARYPGLTDVTVAVARLTGLSVFSSGTIVIGVARVVLCLALFLLLDRLAGSRVAGIGATIYFANPNFLYWSAQFAYESFALPLMFFALWLALRVSADGQRAGWRLACLATISAVVVTHHVASYALALILCGWVVAAYLRQRRGNPCYVPVGLAAYAVGAAAAWLAFVAPGTSGYLSPVLLRAISAGVTLALHGNTSRQLFAGGGVVVAPKWEQGIAFAAVGLLLVGIPFGLLALRRHVQAHPLLAPLAVGCLLYGGLLPLRLTAYGQETANRSSEYVFLSLGLIDAMVMAWIVGRRPTVFRQALCAAGLVVVLLGGTAVSWAFYERLQPDFSSAGVPTQPTPATVALAWWMKTELGPGHRVGTDSVDDLALGSYGEQDPIVQTAGVPGTPHIWRVFFPTRVNAAVSAEIRADRLQYLVTQQRLTQGTAGSGGYFDVAEPSLPGDRLPQASLTKFDSAPGFSRIYDSGDLALYRIGPQP
jgi:hypothetical protein